ncbi:MAG: DUF285 domain-containing protein [Clostridia bacterium]|nr:DUF285 domain-containing protein [Clostridia bacterium]
MQKCVEVTLNTTGVELNTTYANTIISQDGHYYQNASEDLNIKLKSSSGYAEPPKIDSIQINGSSYEASLDGNNILTIPASAINGNIVINTSAVELLGVSLSGLSNCTSSNANTQIAPNSTYSTTITPNANYKLPKEITVEQDGVELTKGIHYSWNPENGQLEIFEVTGEILITCDAILSECTITFDWNNDVDGLEVTYNNSTTPPTSTTYIPGNSVTLANPTKVGCEFLGWTYTGENVEPLEEPTLNLTLPNTTTGDLEITANWGATLLAGAGNYSASFDKSELFEILWSNFKQSGDPDLLYGNNANYNNGVALYAPEPPGEGPPYYSYSSTLTSITFGYWENYASKFNYNYTSGIENLDEQGEGAIKLFKYGTEAYILSPNKIFANQICNGSLAGRYTYQPYAFYEYKHDKLSSITFENFDTSIATDMSGLFFECSGLTSLDLSNIDTSKVTDMWAMFSGCSGLTSLDLSNFNTSNVIYMAKMFTSCNNLTSLDLSNFNTSKVTNMKYMFSGCSSLKVLDLGDFNTSKVRDMSNMFYNCSNLTTIKTKYASSTAFAGSATTTDWLYDCPATWVQVS